MRRFAGLILAAILASPGGFAVLAAPESAECAMACHANGAGMGASCCLIGGKAEGTVLKSCAASREGVAPPPTCRLAPPRGKDALPSPDFAGRVDGAASAVLIARAFEPPDPVPLRLS